MKNVEYEWVYETVDIDGEITNVCHSSKLDELPRVGLEVALVREDFRRGSHKAWAYIVDGELPTMMLDAYGSPVCKVPAEYRKQFERFLEKVLN